MYLLHLKNTPGVAAASEGCSDMGGSPVLGNSLCFQSPGCAGVSGVSRAALL